MNCNFLSTLLLVIVALICSSMVLVEAGGWKGRGNWGGWKGRGWGGNGWKGHGWNGRGWNGRGWNGRGCGWGPC